MRLPPSVQTEAVLEYLAGRLTQPWTGLSADALIAAAITDTQPIYAPSDLDDLSRCFFAFSAAPDELIAMRRGRAWVDQCAQCGLLAAVTDLSPVDKLGPCPACSCPKWWRQQLPVGPFHEGAA